MKSFKGFDKDLKCRGFQYKVGETYKHDGDVVPCKSGFHSCPSPLNVFNYYMPSDSRYCVVVNSGTVADKGDKLSADTITVEKEITIHEMVIAHNEIVTSEVVDNAGNTGHRSAASNTGNYSAASNTGNYSAASNTGDYSSASNTGNYSSASDTGNYSAASNTGNCSAASNTGDCSAASNTGDCSAASNTGYRSAASNTGDYSAASNTGDYSSASDTGNYSAASNTGDCSAASVEGLNSVAIVTGTRSKAMASDGSWIVITERDSGGEILNIRTAKSGRDVKPGTYYKLVNGEFVECL